MAQQTSDSAEGDEEADRGGGDGGGRVHVVCCADVLLPFIDSREPLELLEDTSISILPASATASTQLPQLSLLTSRWWLCDLLRCEDVPGVESAIDQLTYMSHEWAVGWQAHSDPDSSSFPHTAAPVTSSHFTSSASSSRRSRSAATFAVLRVRQPLHPKQYRSLTVSAASSSSLSSHAVASSPVALLPASFPSFPSVTFVPSRSLRRGCDVHVIASPYGLLSPAVFHNSVSGGIVSNVVHPFPSTAAETDFMAPSSDSDASVDSVVMRDTVAQTAFPAADVSFPRHLHFPIQGHPTSSSSMSTPPSGAVEHVQAMASVFLTDCRCLPGSEGGPVVLSTHPSKAVLLAGLVTLPLHLTNLLSPVLLNNVVSAEAVWLWLHQDERTVPHPHFHSLVSSPTVAVVSPVTSSTAFASPCSSTLSPVSFPSKAALSSSLSLSSVSASRVSVDGMIQRADRSLAIARVRSSWASAIVLTADGYIATNAHLLAPFHLSTGSATTEPAVSSSSQPQSAQVLVSLPASIGLSPRSRRWYKASVVYVCRSPWDLALLKINPTSPLTPVALPLPSTEPARPGDPVYVLGHALFSPSSMLLPTLTRGVLSQCVSMAASSTSSAAPERSPILLQTDSAVHNGNSGGLLLSRTGLCLGMITSNVQHTALPTAPDSPTPASPPSTTASSTSSVIIPQLNLSIPAAVLLRLRSRLQQQRAATESRIGGVASETEEAGAASNAVDVWRDWEADDSMWRAAVERTWGLSVVDVWEADMKPRSSKFAEVVERVERMEREEQARQSQQHDPPTEASSASNKSELLTTPRPRL